MSPVRRVEILLKRRNVRGLCRALHHRNVLIRRRAAQALGELAEPAAVPCLERLLHIASDDYVIRRAIRSLAIIGGPPAIDALTDAAFSSSQQIASLAARALAEMPDPQAAAALKLKEMLFRNDWDALVTIGEQARRPLSVILQSEQYAAWPSGKRKQVLTIATKLGVKPTRQSGEMLNMGLFVSGVHTVGDLIRGLGHRNPEVRIAAAQKLALSGQPWTTGPLYRRFHRELRAGGDRSVAIAIACALAQLDDERALAHYKDRLHHAEGAQAADAARALADIGTPDAVRTLFWFAASPPPPPAYRNVPMTLSALQSVGPAALDVLRPYFEHEEASIRRLMIEVSTRCGHPDIVTLLSKLARDDDPEVQHAALDAIADLNTAEAAQALLTLADDAPRRWVARALASITHPDGPKHLRTLVPDVTTLHGTLVEDDRRPLAGAHVQIVKEHFFGDQAGWGWQAVSARARTAQDGTFALVLLTTDEDARLRLKVTIPSRRDGTQGETFFVDFQLAFGKINHLKTRIDRFFNRLAILSSTHEPED